MEMETSSEEEEDGQISKLEEEEEKYKTNTKNPEDEPVTMEDLRKCWLARDVLVKHCMAPWFEDFVKGLLSYPTLLSSFIWPMLYRMLGSVSIR
jgi:RNA polymerase-associated protein RTF1